MSTETKDVPCRQFSATGHCEYGDKCWYSHKPVQAQAQKKFSLKSPTASVQAGNQSTTTRNETATANVPCRYFKAGNCTKGESCPFKHEVEELKASTSNKSKKAPKKNEKQGAGSNERNVEEMREEAKRTKVAEEKRKAPETAPRPGRNEKRGGGSAGGKRDTITHTLVEEQRKATKTISTPGHRARKPHQDDERVLKQKEIAEQEACATIRWVVMDGSALATCGAGLDIRYIVCGFESCFIAIKNLPPNVTKHEVEELFIQQGVDISRFCVVKIMPTTNNEAGAKIICDSQLGEAIAPALDGSEFQDRFLDVTIDNGGIPNKMGSASERSANFLTITWELSTITMVAQYATPNDAQNAVKKLNKAKFEGRNIQVKLNRSRQLRTSSTSIKIWDLPPSVTTSEIERLSGAISVKIAPGAASYDKEDVEKFLRKIMTQRKGFESYEASPPNPEKYIAQARVRFGAREYVESAQEYMESQMSEWGYPQLRFSLSKPLQYVITIPLSQYRAQKGRWDSLPMEQDNSGAFVRVADNKTDKAFIRVLGEDKTAVGQLKVRVENLVAGESLDPQLWHRSFMGPDGQRLLEKISTRSKAYVRGDVKSKTLKLHADNNTKQAVIRLIKAEIKRLEASEWSEPIDRRAIGFFVRSGLPTLKQELGEDAAMLALYPSPRLIISDGEKARRLVDRLIMESRKGIESDAAYRGEDTCPVCFDEVMSPVMLTCGHFYCTSCLQHLLSSAADRKAFPIVCAGAEGKCKAPIAVPIIQRHLQQQFVQLVEAAVTTYIEKRPTKFKYCRTPGCQQVYRCEKGGKVLACPCCFATVCATCHREAHEGMTCKERELMNIPGEQERLNEDWARNAGAKRCPSCRVWLQKMEGCNHITCQCGTHICWLCLRTFPEARAVYGHLRADHGSIHDEATQRERLVQEQADLAMAQRLHKEENRRVANVGQFQARVQQERAAKERARDRNIVEEQHHTIQALHAEVKALSQGMREMEVRRIEEEQRRAARKEKGDCSIM